MNTVIPSQNLERGLHKNAVFFWVIVFLLILAVSYFAGNRYFHSDKVRDQESHDAFIGGILGNDPAALQASFLNDIKDGINDKYTKSDAYFITHRFFDNGGNLYEVYDYINSHPELSFIEKEAEQIYPVVFERIKNKTLPRTYVDASYYGYLAYVEVLYKHGYTDIAAISTLANQYAKLAYFNVSLAKEMSPEDGKKRTEYSKRDAIKAAQFLQVAQKDVSSILGGKLTEQDVTSRDILVGLNQYAAASRYIEAFLPLVNQPASTLPDSFKNSRQVFDFATEYSHRNVPELTLFTSLLNASTLAILASSTPAEVKNALFPILDFKPSANTVSNSVVFRVLDTRLEAKPANIGETNMDLYSKRNTLRLARIVPEFKQWLINNGWKETDFK